MPGMQSRIQLCHTTDVENGGALKVEAAGLALAVFNVDGEFFVIDDACTVSPPCLVPVKIYAVTVEQGMILIDAPETV
jgi:nitrite reductase/ring-hydroxylating ferredoxin subunit